jgi:TetR/AcrR family transcriptional regulator, repressor of fatR-cypB operon
MGAISRGPRAYSSTDETHEAILAAALTLFASKGFHGTTMPEVGARARVGNGTLYRHFASKEQLVNALFRRWKTTFDDEVLRQLPVEVSSREHLHSFFVHAFEFARRYPTALVFLELHHHADYLDRESARLDQKLGKRALDMFTSAVSREALRAARPDVLFFVVWGIFMAVARASANKQIVLTDEVVEEAEQCAWLAIARTVGSKR